MKSLKRCVVWIGLLPLLVSAQGKVYFVIGSDTGIWEGMDVSRFHCTYNLGLFADATRNTATVMDPAFRAELTDPFGTPMKLTWWMMAGNIFRHATNADVPYPSTMTLWLMRRYHGDRLQQWGDELTLHYHTFVWTDDNGDGRSYWNQARTFAQTSADFDATLADLLLDEEVFPVSFRSGWHAMDNVWQHRLDEILPYSLHNDWPAKRDDLSEPLDNIYDWSRAPSTFVPFHPATTDYQVPGDGPSWNVRSVYLSRADSTFMDAIFARAAAGVDQVVCLWAHLPETDFPANLQKAHRSARAALARYPGVTYRYCTGVEAMQRWLGVIDSTGPAITVEMITEGDLSRWRVVTDEPIFQPVPFVAVKDRYGERTMLRCVPAGDRAWETIDGKPTSDIMTLGVAATDTSGNLTTRLIRYLPDDRYVDDEATGYAEMRGGWSAIATPAWGRTARSASVPAGDSAVAVWSFPAVPAGRYQIGIQVPMATSASARVRVAVTDGFQEVAAREFTSGIAAKRWEFIGVYELSATSDITVSMTVVAPPSAAVQASADVVRLSAAVKDRWLLVSTPWELGEVLADRPAPLSLTLRNEGISPVAVTALTSAGGGMTVVTPLPVTVPAMGEAKVECVLDVGPAGPVLDTLTVFSDDPRHPASNVVVQGRASEYFVIVDNADPAGYQEAGAWSTSVAQAYGPSSRYAYPAAGTAASFEATLEDGGRYQIRAIVPTTVNASTRARYRLFVGGLLADSTFIDQNTGSGSWVTVFEREIPAGTVARVDVADAMDPVIAGRVLRSDAIRFQWVTSATPVEAARAEVPSVVDMSVFPNPFNPATHVRFSLPRHGWVTVSVVDLLGRTVATLRDGPETAGTHTAVWNAASAPSGVYFGCVAFEGQRIVRSMQLVR